MAAEVEPALGGDFLAALRNERGLIGTEPAGDADDLGAGRELDIEHPDGGAHPLQVVILDVPAVLPKVSRDAVGARGFAEARRLEGVGLIGSPCLPHRGHVIHVDVEPHRRRHCPGFREGLASQANLCQVRDL